MEWIIGIVTGLISGLVTGISTCWYFYRRSGKDLKQEAENLYRRSGKDLKQEAENLYRRSAKDLKQEAENLRQLNILVIRALVQAGLAKVNFDANGKPIGLVYNLSASAGAVSLSGSVTHEVLHNPQNQGQTGA